MSSRDTVGRLSDAGEDGPEVGEIDAGLRAAPERRLVRYRECGSINTGEARGACA